MGIDIRAKGQNGEREVCDILNYIVYQAMKDCQFPEDQCLKGLTSVQRNQNQSAVGGNDLTNTFGLSIEIKRQEALAVNAWWQQCVAAADRNGEVPVLMYRQNRKPWHVVTYAWIQLPDGKQMQSRVEFDIDSFKAWFRQWVLAKISMGYEVRF